ncbi:SAM-dependent methyltransferase [Yersinia intermedia]|uniref:SAM-dependent methyltransferase n=1 Tax=Yersinia intermedia TaxID=631 RepID=UPI000B709299|nr:SAM-dependent methyltransferase [Yersinia intermedia]MCW8110150.1 hypothetical protein [Yersinia intermedia]MDA5515131.1 hypothetical protein [Yersinia intermedia]OWF90438.1 hypothetical protein B4916_15815 [Yersinia intermedia]
MITQKIEQGLLVSTIKNQSGEYVSHVSGADMINGPVTVKSSSIDDLIEKIKPYVQQQPDFVWSGFKDALSKNID